MVIDAPNIFQPRNDWNIRSLQCKTPNTTKNLPKEIARIIESETRTNPFVNLKSRGSKKVMSRYLLMDMMLKYTKWTYSNIADLVGKDHSTVSHSKEYIENYLITDDRFRHMYKRIDGKIKELVNHSSSLHH